MGRIPSTCPSPHPEHRVWHTPRRPGAPQRWGLGAQGAGRAHHATAGLCLGFKGFTGKRPEFPSVSRPPTSWEVGGAECVLVRYLQVK